jgi:hypothetical protein
MKSRNLLFLSVVFVLLATARDSNAHTQTKPVTSTYNVEAVYDEARAVIGNKNLELKITVQPLPGATVRESDRLTLTKVHSVNNPAIQITQTSRGHGGNVYLYNVELMDGLEPRNYKLTLEFLDQQQNGTSIIIDLDVGVRSEGKLKLIEEKREPLVLGTKRVLELKFVNLYVDYQANINKIKIDSIPSGIIESMEVIDGVENGATVKHNVILFDPVLTIEPFQRRSVDVVLKLGGMPSLQNYIMGFGDDSKLKVAVTYDDGRGRFISDLEAQMDVKLRPNDRFLVGALIIGLLVGTGIKFYLEYLRKKGAITKKGVAGFVVITMIVGLVVFVVTWLGQIQIIAFKTVDLSYDKPGVIFILGCAGSLAGVHYLNKWLKFTPPGGR